MSKNDKLNIMLDDIFTCDKDVARNIEIYMNTLHDIKIYEQAKQTRIIWQSKGKDQRWKYKTLDGKIVAKTNEEDIRTSYISYCKAIKTKTKTTFQKVYNEWVDYQRDDKSLSPSTIRDYERQYERFCNGAYFEATPIRNIDSIYIEQMLRYIISHNDIKRERIKTFCGVLRNVFRYARRYQYIDSNPTEEIDFKRIYRQCEQNVKIDEEETLTDEELAKLLSVIHRSEYEKPEYLPNYAVELIALTGMRAGEVIALEISDIDNKKQVIHISKSIHRNDFKYKPCEYVIGPTKTGKDRTFPITDDVKELLGRIDRIRNEYGIDSERLFGPISGNQLTHTMSRRCKRAGIDSKSTHDLRRTLSSNLAKSGMSIGTIALLLGHLPETNKRFYQYDTTSHSEKCAILSSLWQRIDNAEIG